MNFKAIKGPFYHFSNFLHITGPYIKFSYPYTDPNSLYFTKVYLLKGLPALTLDIKDHTAQ